MILEKTCALCGQPLGTGYQCINPACDNSRVSSDILSGYAEYNKYTVTYSLCSACGEKLAKDATVCPRCGKNNVVYSFSENNVERLLKIIISILRSIERKL